MNRLLAVAVLSAVTFCCGCSTVETSPLDSSAKPSVPPVEIIPAAKMAAISTHDLTTRRAQLHQMIAEIQREVEFKAGLHMGVAIHDDRAKLNELYLEARQIDRELLRRAQSTEGGPRIDSVKAEF
jgi:4-alpha-glucanotransferase